MESSHCSIILTRKSIEQSEKYYFLITLIRILKTVSINNIFDWETTTDWHLDGTIGEYFCKRFKNLLAPFKKRIGFCFPLYPLSGIFFIPFLIFGRLNPCPPKANCLKYSPMEGGESTLLSQRKYNDIIKDTYCTLSRENWKVTNELFSLESFSLQSPSVDYGMEW